MHFFAHDIMAVIIASAIMSLIFAILYYIERKEYLLYWCVSWLLFSTALVFRMISILNDGLFLAQFLGLTFNFIGGLMLLLGTFRFLNLKIIRFAVIILCSMFFLFLLISAVTEHEVYQVYFVYVCTAVIFFYTGVIIYRNTKNFSYGGRVAGITIFLWGFHQLDYPFVRNIDWFMPVGYQIAVMLILLTATGYIMMHFEKVKRDFENREQLFKFLADSSRNIVFTISFQPEIKLTYVSPYAEKITGYKVSEIMAEKELQDRFFFDFINSTFGLGRQFHSNTDTPRKHNVEVRGGKEAVLEYSYVCRYGFDGEIENIIGYATDVTENILDFSTMIYRHEWYEAIFQKSSDMHMLVRLHDRLIVDANAHILMFLGCYIEDIRDTYFCDQFADMQEAERFWENYRDGHVSDAYVVIDKEKNEKNVLISFSTLEYSDIQYLYLSFTDISNELYFRTELDNITTRHKAILESLQEGVVGIDENADVFFINKYASSLLGYLPGEIIGKNLHETIHKYENSDNDEGCRVLEAINDHQNISGLRNSFVRRDKKVIPVEISLSQMKYFDESKSSILIFRNIENELEYESKLLSQIKENEVLLQEVHHRVKNNLQIISSILSLQTNFIEDEEIKKPFFDSIARIHSMALIHEHLYQAGIYSSVDLKKYIERLVLNLHGMFTYDNNISLELDLNEVFVPLDYAVPYGLILTELFTNAVKHVNIELPAGEKIFIGLERSDDEVVMTVRDSGSFTEDQFKETSGKSLGYTIINSLIKQINGRIQMSSDDGFEVKCTGPLSKEQASVRA